MSDDSAVQPAQGPLRSADPLVPPVGTTAPAPQIGVQPATAPAPVPPAWQQPANPYPNPSAPGPVPPAPVQGAPTWQAPGAVQPQAPAGASAPQQGWAPPGAAAPHQGQWAVPGGTPNAYGVQPAYPGANPAGAWGAPGATPAPGGIGANPYAQASSPVWMNLRPGIIPLRPLTLGDVLEGAVKLVRHNPRTTLGLSLIVQLIVAVLAIGLSMLGTTALMDLGGADLVGVSMSLASSAPTMVAAPILGALLVTVVLEAVLGRKPSIGQVWQATKSRILPLIGAQALIGGVTFLILGLVMALFIVLLNNQAWAAAGISALILIPLAIAATLYLSVKTMFVGPAVVAETRGPIEAIKRSWALSRSGFWRILGIYLLASVIISFVAGILATPVTMVTAFLGVNDPYSADSSSMLWATAITILVTQLVAALTTPFLAGVSNLLYVDQRMRTEGLDIELVNAASQQA